MHNIKTHDYFPNVITPFMMFGQRNNNEPLLYKRKLHTPIT